MAHSNFTHTVFVCFAMHNKISYFVCKFDLILYIFVSLFSHTLILLCKSINYNYLVKLVLKSQLGSYILYSNLSILVLYCIEVLIKFCFKISILLTSSNCTFFIYTSVIYITNLFCFGGKCCLFVYSYVFTQTFVFI